MRREREREKDRGLFVVTRYILITISSASQWRLSTSSALLHARLAIYKKNANSEFDEERMKEEEITMNRQNGRHNERTVADFRVKAKGNGVCMQLNKKSFVIAKGAIDCIPLEKLTIRHWQVISNSIHYRSMTIPNF